MQSLSKFLKIPTFFKHAFQTTQGTFMLLGVLVLGALSVVLHRQDISKKSSDPVASKIVTKATTHEFNSPIASIDSGALVSSAASGDAQKAPTTSIPEEEQKRSQGSVLPSFPSPSYAIPMRVYAAAPKDEAMMSEAYLPYGRLIKCVLVNTVDSSRITTPIIGMVLEDVSQNGICVIPAGTEVHGTAQIDRSRERIASEKEWVVVWQDGRELPVKGIVLSNTQYGTEQQWGITDGSAGLEGEILKSDRLAQLKEIVASTVAAAGSGLVPVTTTSSPFGNTQVTTTGSAEAVLGSSLQAAGRVYAEQIMQSIQRDGWFVRCAAGSKFYLYLLESVDTAHAGIGANKSGGVS